MSRNRTAVVPIVILLLFCGPLQMQAQCGSTVSTYPYSEGFETAAAWTAGGNASDWTWGTPNKPVINSAGGGTRCWNVGGLVGSFYSNGQQSWLESPCFDLGSLVYPWISFKLFWETERNYDGMGLQYSLNEGATWTNLGSVSGAADCLNANWFNSTNIVGLNLAQPKQGWSGRVGPSVGNCGGGNGSAVWLTASQCLTQIEGQSSVKFRFIFGAGTVCNGFDGVAVDDIFIGEAPANAANFAFACNGNTVEFQDLSALCPTSSTWNFGDPASGAANTASGAAALHTYNTGGTYTITLAVGGPCNAPSTITRTIFVAEPELTTVDPTCGEANGSITVLLPDAPPGVLYSWSNGATGAVQNDLAAGAYSVTVSGTDVCGSQSDALLVDNALPLVVDATVSELSCAGINDGAASLSVSGGTAPYTYEWSPGGSIASLLNGLPAGSYTCDVTDALGCSQQVEVLIEEPEPLSLEPQTDVTICSGESIVLDAMAEGGTAPYTFAWSPSGPAVEPSGTSTYTVIATDANGCTSLPGSVIVTVVEALQPSFDLDEALGCTPHCVTFTAQNVDGGSAMVWDFGDGATSSDPSVAQHCYGSGGVYDVALTVTDATGCTGSFTLPEAVTAVASPVAQFIATPAVATIDEPFFTFRDASSGAVEWSWDFGDGATSTESDPAHAYTAVGCYPVELRVANTLGCADSVRSEVCVEDAFVLWAPNAFTPDNDGVNDRFGVVTTVGSTDLYELLVFDRWGRQVFVGQVLGEGWDGTISGTEAADGIYAWTIALRDRTGLVQRAKGHVLLMR